MRHISYTLFAMLTMFYSLSSAKENQEEKIRKLIVKSLHQYADEVHGLTKFGELARAYPQYIKFTAAELKSVENHSLPTFEKTAKGLLLQPGSGKKSVSFQATGDFFTFLINDKKFTLDPNLSFVDAKIKLAPMLVSTVNSSLEILIPRAYAEVDGVDVFVGTSFITLSATMGIAYDLIAYYMRAPATVTKIEDSLITLVTKPAPTSIGAKVGAAFMSLSLMIAEAYSAQTQVVCGKNGEFTISPGEYSFVDAALRQKKKVENKNFLTFKPLNKDGFEVEYNLSCASKNNFGDTVKSCEGRDKINFTNTTMKTEIRKFFEESGNIKLSDGQVELWESRIKKDFAGIQESCKGSEGEVKTISFKSLLNMEARKGQLDRVSPVKGKVVQ